MAAGAVSLRKSHDIVILSICNIVKGQANGIFLLDVASKPFFFDSTTTKTREDLQKARVSTIEGCLEAEALCKLKHPKPCLQGHGSGAGLVPC